MATRRQPKKLADELAKESALRSLSYHQGDDPKPCRTCASVLDYEPKICERCMAYLEWADRHRLPAIPPTGPTREGRR